MLSIADGVLLLTLAVQYTRADAYWCYYCNWTTPHDIFKCEDMSAQCIRCNDPVVACVGKSCFRYVAHNGALTFSFTHAYRQWNR